VGVSVGAGVYVGVGVAVTIRGVGAGPPFLPAEPQAAALTASAVNAINNMIFFISVS
jgi:hypothetical protein